MQKVISTTGLVYGTVDGIDLLADLHRPDTDSPAAVVVYVHGGGWAVGSRADGRDTRLAPVAAHGVAVLSIDYRLVPDAVFPAQVHDVKAAVRWLRARGGSLGLATDRIAVWGASAGAVLAGLVGLSCGDPELEGDIGEHLDQPSSVEAVVSWFGQSDLLSTTSRSWLEEQIVPFSFEARFLGVETVGEVARVASRAQQASPVHRVTGGAPPFLIAHGDRDRVVPVTESQHLHAALVRAGARSTLIQLGGAGHEDGAFDSAEHLAMTAGFLHSVLQA